MNSRLPRKLAAIFYADVAGYSRLTGADEDETHRTLSEYLDYIAEAIRSHGGNVVHYAGDAVLARFDAVVDAVSCAATIQDNLAERSGDQPDECRLQFRIGVNLGDVIEDRGDIYGDGVNVAARLESLADPGGICISESVHTALGNKLVLNYEDIGEQLVKNIAKPVRAYKIKSTTSYTGSNTLADQQKLIASESNAIAVLPFANMSNDPEQEYFSDGLTEDLITALALWRSFPVIARHSSFVYKGRSVNVKQVASELDARYILEGSVRKGGNRVRITAQLIDGKSAHHIWAEKYDRELNDIFALQDDITRRIATMIVPEVRRTELSHSTRKRQTDLNAWDYYLRGMALTHEFSKEGNSQAREMFERALQIDPKYSDAYSGVARTYHRDILMEYYDDRCEMIFLALEASRCAVALDASSADAHMVLSTAHAWRNEPDFALAEGKIAVELNPNDALSLHALGNKVDLAGDSEGIEMMLRAQRLNPLDSDMPMRLTFLARAYVNNMELDKAIECSRLAIQKHATYPHAYFILAIALAHAGRMDEAGEALNECERLKPGLIESRIDWRPYANDTNNQYFRDGLKKARNKI
ncbi:adenylate/guanylate cyclase domain-containing protein [Gammaproteobacteria bacterium]|nr:adenylate/guanylate cyclase domain-containing protein [Gammaproteobacteria bacterium]